MIAVIDYKMGNLGSLTNALSFLGCDFTVSSKPDEILSANKIILPGVGSFSAAMKHLEEWNLVVLLKEAVSRKNIPILGICLGMQILASSGEEGGPVAGLGLIKGSVNSISSKLPEARVPHIGFNSVDVKKRSPDIFEGISTGTDFYFLHSYHFDCGDIADISSTVEYGGYDFTASVQKGNVFGVQFHPEKSQGNGLRVLKNFISMN